MAPTAGWIGGNLADCAGRARLQTRQIGATLTAVGRIPTSGGMRGFRSSEPEILPPEDGEESRVRARFWKTVKKAVASIPFLDEVIAAYYCAFDSATPAPVRATLLGALAYFVMPFDVLPDVLLGIGFTDDITVLATAIALVRGNITEAHRQAARAALARLSTDSPA